MTIRVLRAGLLTTVQDDGRRGHQHEGVPESGAMDAWALRVANLLVGNGARDAALELTLAGPRLHFAESALVVLTGATMRATVDGDPVPGWRPVLLAAGATLDIGAASAGARGYLAVAGGIDVPHVLGSRSTYLRAALGGLDGRALRAGDLLPTGAASPLALGIADALRHRGSSPSATCSVATWGAAREIRPDHAPAPWLRLTSGTHAGLLTGASQALLFGESFRVSPQSDRMGYRLDGPALALTQPLELRSEAVAFGTVQLPPAGAPIVLMADRQTTGGYPRIGEVATVDHPLLAQLRPGDTLRFRPVSLSEAQRAYVARERDLALFAEGIRLRHR